MPRAPHKLSPFLAFLFLGFSLAAQARELVTDATIKLQKDSSFQFELENKIPVTYRLVPDSEIFLVSLNFDFGDAYLRPEDRPALGAMTKLMERGSTSYPKEALLTLLEKYSTSINCGMGIEMGNCVMSALNPYLGELLPAFASVALEPSFDPAEAKIVFEQAVASEQAALQNPETFANEVVNNIFYGKKHPYWASQEDRLAALSRISLDQVKALHKRILDQVSKRIIVVGSLPIDQVKAMLNKNFALLKTVAPSALQVPLPAYDAKKSFQIGARNIPTSYVRAKFVMPGATSPDAVAAQLMIHILSEELENEVRTKRSLSYSVYAQLIPYTMGIGVLHASTSRPKETLEAIRPIIKKLRETKMSRTELDRYKTVFATNYYLSLEEHSSLAGSLSNAMLYFKGTDRLYDMPRLLAKVSPEDIQRAAETYLRQFRLGVVYKDKGFSPAWAESFLRAFP